MNIAERRFFQWPCAVVLPKGQALQIAGWLALTEDEFDRVVTLDGEGDPAARRFVQWLSGEVLPAMERGHYREGGYYDRWVGEVEAEITRITARLRPQ